MKPEERKGLLVGSKVGDECPPYSDNGGHNAFSYDGVMSSVEHSLKQLKVVDKLETCLVHDATMNELEQFLEPGNGMDALRELKRQGLVGHIGIGCLEFPQHRKMMEHDDCSVLLSVNDMNLVRRYGAEESWI